MAKATSNTNSPVMLTDTKVASFKPSTTGGDEYRDLKVTGLRLRVGSSGKKTWLIRARAGDKVVNKKLGNYPAMGLAAARTAAERLLAALGNGDAKVVHRTFKDAADAWVEQISKTNKSWQFQKRCLELHVYPKWGERKLIDIRRGDVRELLDGLEGSIPNRILATIRPIFRFALARDWIDATPVEGIERPKPDVARDRVLDMGELTRIWNASSRIGYPFTDYIRVLMLTGQRRTEVASMRWEQIDMTARTWTLESGDTKSSRAHLVPLSTSVIQILEALPRFGDFVFTTGGESHISGYAKMKARLDAFIAADGGEPMKPWRLHDLRRSVATHLVRLGVLEEVVGKVLNHASQGVTAKVYALHRYEPEKRSALDRWAAELDRAVGGRPEDKVVQLHA